MLTQQGSIFFKLLLNKYVQVNQEAFLHILPEEEQKKVIQHVFESNNPLAILPSSLNWLEHVHYSWLEATIQSLPATLQKSTISALTKEQRNGLIKRKLTTNISEPDFAFTQPVRSFLLSKLYEVWKEKEVNKRAVLARELLPDNSLLPLLDCSKRELVEIIDLLAMHDLSEEVRHIVDKKLLQAILLHLTSRQQKYLKACLHQKAKMAMLPLNVKDVYKDRKAFSTLLHKRGLKRFALGLCGSGQDFIWHITHTLDTGRGKIVNDACQKETDVQKTTQMIRLEILAIIQLLKKEAM